MDAPPKRLWGVEKASLSLQNLLKGSSRRRAKAATSAIPDGLVYTAPSAQPLIGTKRLERISAALKFPAPLYMSFLQLQSYLDASSGLVEESSELLVDIESSDEVSDVGGLVTATILLRRSWGAILMRIPHPGVP